MQEIFHTPDPPPSAPPSAPEKKSCVFTLPMLI